MVTDMNNCPYHHQACPYPGGGGGRGLLPISPLGLFISWREGGGAYYPYHHLGCSYPGGKGVGGGEGLLPIFILGGSVLSKASICSVHVFQT